MIRRLNRRLHIPYKSTSQVYGEDEPNSMNETDGVELPSVTVWDSPHSSFEASDVPFFKWIDK